MPSGEIHDVEGFRRTVYDFYRSNARDFPWRRTREPYLVLVSEVMLQQTQTSRVLPAYLEFVRRFPDISSLAASSTRDVLTAWQGLGYNRRARALSAAARLMVEKHDAAVPRERADLLALPGVGGYTASAVRTFAFGIPEVFVETNIRAVYIRHFFDGAVEVHDRDMLPLVELTLDRADPRAWYYALMDYGAALKRGGNAARRSSHYRKQSRFEGSRRQARSVILRAVLDHPGTTQAALERLVGVWDSRFDEAMKSLLRDGLLADLDGLLLPPP